MKQLLQRLDNGATTLVDVPVPAATGGTVVVETRATIVSPGTERMLLAFGRSNLIEKARSQPEKAWQVVDKMRADGIGATLEAVRAKLNTPIPLGYCHAGVIVDAGARSAGFRVGERVVTNGSHAEYVRVPVTLAARIPESVSFESAAFAPLAAIGLQGIRLAAPTLGETVVVFGLGVIGLLTVQLLRANGCRVIGIDREPSRLQLASQFGAHVVDCRTVDPTVPVMAMTAGVGADAVLLTLASESNQPVRQAAAMSRKRGRLVLVGVTGLNLVREDFYRKELSFAVSCSYGPGRYDPAYEDQAQDYPLPFVRWTEQRNFEAVLQLMADGLVDPTMLITHRFAFEDAPVAYEIIGGAVPSLGVVLTYPDRGGAPPEAAARTVPHSSSVQSGAVAGTFGVLGAGNFAVRTLLPLLKDSGARLRCIASSGGRTGAVAGEKFGFERITTDTDVVLTDPEVDAVFVLTRHDSHAGLAKRALEAGKHVFVEKPLALSMDDLEEVAEAAKRSGRLLMVGFNRRFAPLSTAARRIVSGRTGPLSLILTMNPGAIPRDHWTQDPDAGGGRIVGEACHFIDLARFLVGAPIVDLSVTAARDAGGRPVDDIAHLSLRFENGSTATVHYLSNGAQSFPKERVEAFFDGKTLVIDNWRRLRRFGVKGPLFERARRMDKGHRAEVEVWLAAVRSGGPPPIPLGELLEISRWAIRAGELARS